MYIRPYIFFPSAHGGLKKAKYIAVVTVVLRPGSTAEEDWQDPKWQSLQMKSLLQGKDTLQQERESQSIHQNIWLTVGAWTGQVQAPIVLSLEGPGQMSCGSGTTDVCTEHFRTRDTKMKSLLSLFIFCSPPRSSPAVEPAEPWGRGWGVSHQTRCNSSSSSLLINKADKLGQTTLKVFGLLDM